MRRPTNLKSAVAWPGRLHVVTVVGLFLAVSSAHASLIAHYRFDSDFADASVNANDLTVGGGSPGITTTSGEYRVGAGALDLNSTISDAHYLNLTTPISFSSGDTWSVVFWARHRPGTDDRAGMIVGDLSNSNFIWIPQEGIINGGLRFRNSTGGNGDYTTGNQPSGVYHHWAVIANGAGSIDGYYDNVFLGSKAVTTDLDITSLGQAFSSAVHSMNGQIDELYIYDEAISAATVNSLFNAVTGPVTIPEPTTGLLLATGLIGLGMRRRI